MEYTTLQNLKDRFGVTDNQQDDKLSLLITSITKIIDNYLWFNLEKDEHTDYIVNNNTAKILFFPKKPITKILELEDITGVDVTMNVRRFELNMVYLDIQITGEVKAIYEAGYDTLAEIPDVESVCLDMCEQAYNIQASWNVDLDVKQKKIEDMSVTYFSKDETMQNSAYRENSSFEAVLDQYRVLDLYSV